MIQYDIRIVDVTLELVKEYSKPQFLRIDADRLVVSSAIPNLQWDLSSSETWKARKLLKLPSIYG